MSFGSRTPVHKIPSLEDSIGVGVEDHEPKKVKKKNSMDLVKHYIYTFYWPLCFNLHFIIEKVYKSRE